MRSRRRRKKAGLRFNLSDGSRSVSTWIARAPLFVATGLFCWALLFALDRDIPPQPVVVGTVDTTTSPGVIDGNGLAQSLPKPNLGQRTPAGRRLGTYAGRLEKCGRRRFSCVVDGDTLWLEGEKIRIADIDTPEIGRPSCRQELELGLLATQRLIELLNDGEFEVLSSEWGDVDRYGRKLRVIARGNDSIGQQLVREGFAHRWVGRKLSWC
jgi:endonuclease YncB( thermonuclease family)